MHRFRILLHLTLASFLLIFHSGEATADDRWKTLLSLQLEKDKQCRVMRLTSVQVYDLIGKRNIRAEAHCVDGRVYTVTQSGRNEKFQFKTCPTVC